MPDYIDYLGRAILGLTQFRAAFQSLEGITDLGGPFDRAIRVLCNANRICTTGIGKSGHIARKTASTFSSLGSPAYFINSGEAGHGDLGAISPNDVVQAYSHSGNSPEIEAVISHCKWLKTPIIGITGNKMGNLARNADIPIVYPEVEEFWFKAPTTSSLIQLVIGDMLAVSVAEQKGYRAEDFLQRHPGGAIGKEASNG